MSGDIGVCTVFSHGVGHIIISWGQNLSPPSNYYFVLKSAVPRCPEMSEDVQTCPEMLRTVRLLIACARRAWNRGTQERIQTTSWLGRMTDE